MEIDIEIYSRSCCLLGVKSYDIDPLIQEKEEKAITINTYIQGMQDLLNVSDVVKIINYLISNKIKYELKSYVGLIIVKEYGVNPFDIYENLDDEKRISIDSFFDKTFKDAPYTSNEKILKLMDSIYSKTIARGVGSIILSDMLAYFKSHARQVHDIYKYFLQKPTASCLWVICQISEYYIESDSNSFSKMMHDYVSNANPLVLSAVAVIAKDFYQKLDFKEIIYCLIKRLKIFFDDPEYAVFVLNCIPLGYGLLKLEDEYDQKEDIIDLLQRGIDANNDIRKKLIIEMYSQITGKKKIDGFDLNFISQICTNMNSASEGKTIEYLDWILEWEIENGYAEHAWICIQNLLNRNRKFSMTEQLDFSFDAILRNLEFFLPVIYSDIYISSCVDSLGFQILNNCWNKKGKDRGTVDWNNGLTDDNIIYIAKKIFVSIFNAEFICRWFIFISQRGQWKPLDVLYNIFKLWVCRNYPMTVSREIKNYLEQSEHDTEKLREIAEICDSMLKKQEDIFKMKDFSPDNSRVIKYKIEMKKVQDMMLKKAEEKSSFFMLAKKVPIKYGIRFTSFQKREDEYIAQESEYMLNQVCIERPVLFDMDPLFFTDCINKAFEENKL